MKKILLLLASMLTISLAYSMDGQQGLGITTHMTESGPAINDFVSKIINEGKTGMKIQYDNKNYKIYSIKRTEPIKIVLYDPGYLTSFYIELERIPGSNGFMKYMYTATTPFAKILMGLGVLGAAKLGSDYYPEQTQQLKDTAYKFYESAPSAETIRSQVGQWSSAAQKKLGEYWATQPANP